MNYLKKGDTDMKEIFFVTGTMGRGGAERVISLLSDRYVKLGWRVKILTLLHNTVEYKLNHDIEVIDFSNDKIKASLDIPRLVFKVRSYVKSIKPDVVVAFMAPICLIAGIACRGLNVRLILSERNDPALEPRNKIFKKILENVYKKSSLTVMQTKRARNYFSDEVRKNSVIIPNPIQVTVVGSESRRKRIVAAGRLEIQKNFSMLINAFSRIYDEHPDYCLDIYGDGSMRSELDQQICRLGLSDVVTLRGNVPDIHEQIADAEIFVLSSNFEGLSNALLEAMMMGLACVSTDCAGSDEVIKDGENGLLVRVGNEDELVLAVKKLIEDPIKAKEIGNNAALSARRFSVGHVIEMWRTAIEG